MFRSPADRMFAFAMGAAGAIVCCAVLGIFLFLLAESWPAISSVGISRLVLTDQWQPGATAQEGEFGLAAMLVASLAIACGAVMAALPVAMAASIWAVFYAPGSMGRWFLRCMEVMYGLPSVVIGFWGLVNVVPMVSRIEQPGACLLSAIVVLAAMILPGLVVACAAAWRSVPDELMTAAAAVGLRRWTLVYNVILPLVKSHLWDGVVLQAGRALGETMAVLMVCGNVVQFPASLFDPVRPLTANIALEMAYAEGVHRSALFFSGLLLMIAASVLIVLARFYRKLRRNV